MTGASPDLAAVLSSGDPARLYSGLSVLVSTTVDGSACAALASFGALDLLLDPALERRLWRDPDATPALPPTGRDTFARSLNELIATARELPELALYACSASVDTMGLTTEAVESRLDGVLSTPRFLREVGDARLIFV